MFPPDVESPFLEARPGLGRSADFESFYFERATEEGLDFGGRH